jgi:ABC-type branched-subunit amino acid transport system substrate-binding protein
VAILSDGGAGAPQAFHFADAARRLDMEVVLSRRWRPGSRGYDGLAREVARLNPDIVFLSGVLDAGGGQVIRNLRTRLPAETDLIASQHFLSISSLFAAAGPAARGVYVSSPGFPIERLPSEGRHFVAAFGATQGARPVEQASVYAAQAAEVLLDAIAASDGTRRSVAEALLRARVRRGILGDFAFNDAGDTTSAPIAIVRARHGDGSQTVSSPDGAEVVRLIDVPARLLR